MARLVMRRGWENDLLRVAAVDEALHRVADEVAADAADAAPKDTGEGAASIHAEEVAGEWRVTWDPEHDYMRYQEFGTEHMAARPFLRPAARRHSSR